MAERIISRCSGVDAGTIEAVEMLKYRLCAYEGELARCGEVRGRTGLVGDTGTGVIGGYGGRVCSPDGRRGASMDDRRVVSAGGRRAVSGELRRALDGGSGLVVPFMERFDADAEVSPRWLGATPARA